MDAFGSLAPQIDPLTGMQAPSDQAQGKFNRTTDAIVAALRNWIETPGRAMQNGITTDQAVDWAAPTAMGMVAGARLPGGAPEGALGSSGAKLVQPEGIRAYHGSPYDFDRFSLDKIGAGEGAQAYGHGLYFAENEPVARQYRDRLASPTVTYEGREVGKVLPPNDNIRASMNHTEALAALERNNWDAEAATNALARRGVWGGRSFVDHVIENFDRSKVALKDRGRMYEVNIAAKPEQFLDWDKPLRTQPVAETMRDLVPGDLRKTFDFNVDRGISGSNAYYNFYGSKGGLPQASETLREAGIPGIRYLDQGSRMQPKMFERQDGKFFVDVPGTNNSVATGKGMFDTREAAQAYMDTLPKATSNYVVFDPGIIDILRKYGLAGGAAVGAGGTAANDAFGSLAPQAQ